MKYALNCSGSRVFVSQAFIDKDFVIDGWSRVFIQCWDRLEDYIRDYRKSFGEPAELSRGAHQRKHFEILAKECRVFWPDQA